MGKLGARFGVVSQGAGANSCSARVASAPGRAKDSPAAAGPGKSTEYAGTGLVSVGAIAALALLHRVLEALHVHGHAVAFPRAPLVLAALRAFVRVDCTRQRKGLQSARSHRPWPPRRARWNRTQHSLAMRIRRICADSTAAACSLHCQQGGSVAGLCY